MILGFLFAVILGVDLQTTTNDIDSLSSSRLAWESPTKIADTESISRRIVESPANRLTRFLHYLPNAHRGLFVENPNWYLKGIDFTCVSPWNSSSGAFRGGTAISRRHIIFSKHYPISVDADVTFVGESGVATRYRVVATKELPRCDIMIGALDYELTPDIHPAKILPADFAKTLVEGSKWPVVTFNQREEALLSELRSSLSKQYRKPLLTNQKASIAEWKRYGGEIVGGDSGNPAFLLYKGHPILLYCIQGTGAGVGPQIHRYRSRIQQVMDELCPGYMLQAVDLSKL